VQDTINARKDCGTISSANLSYPIEETNAHTSWSPYPYPHLLGAFGLALVDRALKLEEVAIPREVLLNSKVDVVGEGLQDALLE